MHAWIQHITQLPRHIGPLRGVNPPASAPLLNSHQPRWQLFSIMASRLDMRIVRGSASKKKANTEQAAALQRAGQNAYKVGDLQGAIQSFTQV